MISTLAFLISKMEVKSFDDIRKCRKDINIIKSAIRRDSSNYIGCRCSCQDEKKYAGQAYIFWGKSPTFSASCKTSEHYKLHACTVMSNVKVVLKQNL